MKLTDINPATNEGRIALVAIQALCQIRNKEVLYERGNPGVSPEDIMAELVPLADIEPVEQMVINQDRSWEIVFKGHKSFEADTREQAVALAKQFENKISQVAGFSIYPEQFYQCLEGITHEVVGHCEISSKPIFEDDEFVSDGEVMWLKAEEDTPQDDSIDLIKVLKHTFDTVSMEVKLFGDTVNGICQNWEFQQRVNPWLIYCFGNTVAFDVKERNHRFLEESLELVQALGGTKEEALMLVDYVFGRPVGEPYQEVGGVMVTLAALSIASGLNMHHEGDRELARIWGCVGKIRAKQATKPHSSPLPGISINDNDKKLKEGFEAGMKNLESNPDFIYWLNAFNEGAACKGIVIPVEHSDGVKGIYLLRKEQSINKCLDAYEDFTRRLKAISENPQ